MVIMKIVFNMSPFNKMTDVGKRFVYLIIVQNFLSLSLL